LPERFLGMRRPRRAAEKIPQRIHFPQLMIFERDQGVSGWKPQKQVPFLYRY
jgi:hypothetical protein